ncbi:hypothetical protein PO909_001531 [Leuciscus waleckii]
MLSLTENEIPKSVPKIEIPESIPVKFIPVSGIPERVPVGGIPEATPESELPKSVHVSESLEPVLPVCSGMIEMVVLSLYAAADVCVGATHTTTPAPELSHEPGGQEATHNPAAPPKEILGMGPPSRPWRPFLAPVNLSFSIHSSLVMATETTPSWLSALPAPPWLPVSPERPWRLPILPAPDCLA